MIPQFELDNKSLNRTTFLNLCTETRPESYASEVAKDKAKRVKGFNIEKQRVRDLKMYAFESIS